jgi:hypothetical protein
MGRYEVLKNIVKHERALNSTFVPLRYALRASQAERLIGDSSQTIRPEFCKSVQHEWTLVQRFPEAIHRSSALK